MPFEEGWLSRVLGKWHHSLTILQDLYYGLEFQHRHALCEASGELYWVVGTDQKSPVKDID